MGNSLAAQVRQLEVDARTDRRLNASKAKLKTIPADILARMWILKLREINLEGNKLNTVPDAFCNFTTLVILNLSRNVLTQLNGTAVAGWKHLKVLDVSHNQLTTLPPELSELTSLQTLSAQHNQLNFFPASAIPGLTSLQSLDLSYNKYDVLPKTIGRLTALVSLRVSHNVLVVIPDSLADLSHLSEFYVHHNCIRSVPDRICQLPNLKVLELHDNYINEVPRRLVDIMKRKQWYEIKSITLYNNAMPVNIMEASRGGPSVLLPALAAYAGELPPTQEALLAAGFGPPPPPPPMDQLAAYDERVANSAGMPGAAKDIVPQSAVSATPPHPVSKEASLSDFSHVGELPALADNTGAAGDAQDGKRENARPNAVKLPPLRLDMKANQHTVGMVKGDPSSNAVHVSTTCFHCHVSPIVGRLFVCANCANTYCERCEAKGAHNPSHVAVVIDRPVAVLQEDMTRAALLPAFYPEGIDNTYMVHENYWCDACAHHSTILAALRSARKHAPAGQADEQALKDIEGARYKCINCNEYDLCESCWTKGVHRNSTGHFFLKIHHPLDASLGLDLATLAHWPLDLFQSKAEGQQTARSPHQMRVVKLGEAFDAYRQSDPNMALNPLFAIDDLSRPQKSMADLDWLAVIADDDDIIAESELSKHAMVIAKVEDFEDNASDCIGNNDFKAAAALLHMALQQLQPVSGSARTGGRNRSQSKSNTGNNTGGRSFGVDPDIAAMIAQITAPINDAIQRDRATERVEIRVLNALAMCYCRLTEWPSALACLNASMEINRTSKCLDMNELPRLWINIALVFDKSGDENGHLATLQKMIVNLREVCLPGDVHVYEAVQRYVAALKRYKRSPELIQLLSAELSVADSLYGPDSEEVARMSRDLAECYCNSAQWAAAVACYERYVAWILGADDVDLKAQVGAIEDLVDACANAGKEYLHNIAEDMVRGAVAIFDQTALRDDQINASVATEPLRLLGRVMSLLGRTDDALDAYDRIVAAYNAEYAYDDDDPWTLLRLGKLYVKTHKNDAPHVFKCALRELEFDGEDESKRAAEIMLERGKAYIQVDKPLEALASLEHAYRIFQKNRDFAGMDEQFSERIVECKALVDKLSPQLKK